ncbi:MAG: chromosomal replication initiation protein, partial [Actinobacteria bacterium]|nr:chromosomal replication initiation protein [Actinomycetota bacterium]
MAKTDVDLLEDLWSGVVHSISQDSPQNRAFLTLTKPLGLLKSESGSNLLLAAPNTFAKDVLESRLKTALNDALSAKLGERINIAVTI